MRAGNGQNGCVYAAIYSRSYLSDATKAGIWFCKSRDIVVCIFFQSSARILRGVMPAYRYMASFETRLLWRFGSWTGLWLHIVWDSMVLLIRQRCTWIFVPLCKGGCVIFLVLSKCQSVNAACCVPAHQALYSNDRSPWLAMSPNPHRGHSSVHTPCLAQAIVQAKSSSSAI